MSRIATCQCRGFQAIVTGEPAYIGMCHCTECQRRSGVPLTCNAYFPSDQVRLEGDRKVYTRDGAEGRQLHNSFCPTCGATVCWTADLLPGHIGIAVGCFNDPDFPAPHASTWEQSMAKWVTPPDGTARFTQGRMKT